MVNCQPPAIFTLYGHALAELDMGSRFYIKSRRPLCEHSCAWTIVGMHHRPFQLYLASDWYTHSEQFPRSFPWITGTLIGLSLEKLSKG